MTDEISESLVRKLLSQGTDLKASNEAVALVSEFLKVFLQEAHHRASIEADFESSTKSDSSDEHLHDGSDLDAVKSKGSKIDSPSVVTNKKQITEYHILKIAAELLLDFC